MDVQHTPGPWEVAGQFVRTPFTPGESSGLMIADVSHGIWPQGQHAANARLMAAAPDMVAALKSILGNANRADITAAQWKAGLDAVAKAEGRA